MEIIPRHGEQINRLSKFFFFSLHSFIARPPLLHQVGYIRTSTNRNDRQYHSYAHSTQTRSHRYTSSTLCPVSPAFLCSQCSCEHAQPNRHWTQTDFLLNKFTILLRIIRKCNALRSLKWTFINNTENNKQIKKIHCVAESKQCLGVTKTTITFVVKN